MGGCCCCLSSNGVELNNSPPFYHYPVPSEEHEPLSAHQGTASATTGLLVDTNLDTSIPDTYRAPPVPIPYDATVRHPGSPLNNQAGSGNKLDTPLNTANSEPVGGVHDSDDVEVKDIKECDCKIQSEIERATTEKVEDEFEKSGELKKPCKTFVVEECPTCLEEYDEDNPKIITKCEHHFHLACILEWLERSDTCPVCDQEMVFDAPID